MLNPVAAPLPLLVPLHPPPTPPLQGVPVLHVLPHLVRQHQPAVGTEAEEARAVKTELVRAATVLLPQGPQKGLVAVTAMLAW